MTSFVGFCCTPDFFSVYSQYKLDCCFLEYASPKLQGCVTGILDSARTGLKEAWALVGLPQVLAQLQGAAWVRHAVGHLDWHVIEHLNWHVIEHLSAIEHLNWHALGQLARL